tara:strand:+ start:1148 stop:1861 length:714 start_codon:yes stop_codon:yes gene_type:complete
MSKRKRKDHETIDALALHINSDRQKINIIDKQLNKEMEDIISLKSAFNLKIKSLAKLSKQTLKAYQSLDNTSKNILTKLNKSEKTNELSQSAYVYERQLRLQNEDQIHVMDEQIEHLENELANCQIDNDNLREEQEDLYKRIDFVEEAKIHDMHDLCTKFNEIKSIISADNFVTDIKKIHDIISPSESCVVCKSAKNTCAFIPCGHLCVCLNCSELIKEKCPYCQTPFTSVNKVYVV